jgi:DNA polymerase
MKVPGSGTYDTDIVIIGEAPGAKEAEKGEPFVGRSGGALDEMLDDIDLSRSEIFITNTVKCRPPDNRDPRKDELEACKPFLDRQLEMIEPLVVVTLGRFATQYFLPGASISEIHGQARPHGNFVLVPLYHPAAGMYRASLKPTIREDFKSIGRLLRERTPGHSAIVAMREYGEYTRDELRDIWPGLSEDERDLASLYAVYRGWMEPRSAHEMLLYHRGEQDDDLKEG